RRASGWPRVLSGRATAASSSRAWGGCASASAYSGSVPRPMRRQVAKTRRAISPRLATRTVETVSVTTASHSEDAEAVGALDRGVVDGRERHAQHRAGIAGIDHAVVVEPAGHEHRQRLG